MPALTPEQEMLKQAALAATPGKWSWWTSNSYLRLSSERGGDGDILHGARLSDGCCTVGISEANRAFIERANPAAIRDLLAQLEATEGVSTLPSTPLPSSAQLESGAEKFYAIRKEYDEYMNDSFAQQIGVSFADWKLRYKVAAPGGGQANERHNRDAARVR